MANDNVSQSNPNDPYIAPAKVDPYASWDGLLDSFSGGAVSDPRLLALLQKYDPNAGFSDSWANSEGNTRGGEYSYDVSKLPKSKYGDFQQLHTSYTSAYDTNGKIRKDLLDPRKVIVDPVYGRITSRSNIRDQKPGLIDILGPLAVGGVAGWANPGALANLGWGAKAAMAAPTLARTISQKGSLSPMDLLGMAAPFAASAIPGPLGSLMKGGMQAFNTYNAFKGNNTVTGLAGLYNTGKTLLPITSGGG